MENLSTDLQTSVRDVLYKLNSQMTAYNINATNEQRESAKTRDEIQDVFKELLSILRNGISEKIGGGVTKSFDKISISISRMEKQISEGLEKLHNVTISEFAKMTSELAILNELLKERNAIDRQAMKQKYDIKRKLIVILASALGSSGLIYLIVKSLLE